MIPSIQIINHTSSLLSIYESANIITFMFGGLILVSLFTLVTSNQKCHYSCDYCAGSLYTLCFTCSPGQDSQQAKNITVIEDAQLVEPRFRNSDTNTGFCTGEVPRGINKLGIIIFIFCLLMVCIARTKESMYLMSALQNLALLGFIETAWPFSLSYLLQALQYLLIFNQIGSAYKTIQPLNFMTKLTDTSMLERQYYRLHQFLFTSNFLSNFAIVGIFNLTVFSLGVGLAIWKHKHDESEASSETVSQQILDQVSENKYLDKLSEPEESKTSDVFSRQKALVLAYHIVLTFFYLMILESSLVIMVGLRFPQRIEVSTIVISLLYCVMLVLYLVYTGYHPVWFSQNVKCHQTSVWAKISLPVLVIVPLNYHYLIVVSITVFWVLHLMFDYSEYRTKLLSRITLYRIIELLILIFAVTYYGVQTHQGLENPVNAIVVLMAIFVVGFFALLAVETVVGFCYIWTSRFKIENQAESKESRMGHGHNIFDDGPRDETMMEQCPNDVGFDEGQTNSVTRKAEQERLKRQQQLEEQRREKQRRREEEEEQRRREEEEQRRREEEEQRRREEEEQRRREEEEQKKREKEKQRREEEEQRRREEEEQKKREKEEQKKREEEEQRRRKKQEEKKRRQKQEEEERIRKLEEQQYQRKRKQIEEEEEEMRRRKRKQYQGKMDPELRKRYGI